MTVIKVNGKVKLVDWPEGPDGPMVEYSPGTMESIIKLLHELQIMDLKMTLLHLEHEAAMREILARRIICSVCPVSHGLVAP